MKMNHNHPFHLVNMSPWPIISSIGAMTLLSGMIMWFHFFSMKLMTLGLLITTLSMTQWWRDVIRESTFQGLHTTPVYKGMKLGMILFITSEVFFFISFFWAFFHSSLSPSVELGSTWPPNGIITFNPMQIPMLNTIILLCSGISVTWAHHSIMENNHSKTLQALSITIILGVYFTMMQAIEYMESSFTISDSVYGSSFFMATGFHGIHVIIGSTFLLITLSRHMMNQFSNKHHFGFEAAAWYWHFVDVVWLFLYISMYWWGS
nr:cytochrome c oxidase subunit III [Ceratocombus sp. HL-2012]